MIIVNPENDLLSQLQNPSHPTRVQYHSLICLSHLRWDLVFQRPQHLMTRFAQVMPVYFVEESVFEGSRPPYLFQHRVVQNLTVLVPHMPTGMTQAQAALELRALLTTFFPHGVENAPVLWFYTPAALQFADALPAALTVYDCMDELSAFQGALPELSRLESDLLKRADVVLTGGISLYEAKRSLHHNVHAFPSAVDAAHFAIARGAVADPADQAAIPHPRLGFFGVIDERLDRDLIASVARLRPAWQLIFVGPIVKIDASTLPRARNIHYLGGKAYDQLPSYVANWEVAIMPFAVNEATRFISPTKTPEYLAAGKPVVSTPIVDVVRSWGHLEAVRIADSPGQFINEATIALSLSGRLPRWLETADLELEQVSWDRTWAKMVGLIEAALARRDEESGRASTALPGVDPSLHVNGDVRV